MSNHFRVRFIPLLPLLYTSFVVASYLFSFCFIPPSASAGVGRVAYPFLRFPASARQAVLGGAFSAISDDVSALLTNPASVGGLKDGEMSLMHLLSWENTAYSVLTGSIPLASGFNLSWHGVNMNFGKLDSEAELSDGSYNSNFAGRASTYTASAIGVGAGLGIRLAPGVLAGFQGRFVNQSLDSGGAGQSTGMEGDAGLLFDMGFFALGASVLHIGTVNGTSGDSGGASPMVIQGGGALRLGLANPKDFTLAFGAAKYVELDALMISGGAELQIAKAVALRGGYSATGQSNELGSGLYLGGGIELTLGSYLYHLDYAFSGNSSGAGNQFAPRHFMSMRVTFLP